MAPHALRYRSIRIVAIAFAIAALAGAASTGAGDRRTIDTSPAAMEAAPVSEDVDALLERVRLDFRPRRVWWRDGRAGEADAAVPGPTDRFLVATLQLDDAALESLDIALESDLGRERLVDVEPWMAPALRARGERLRVERHDAARFLRRPYTQGRIDRVVGTDFVVLRLGT